VVNRSSFNRPTATHAAAALYEQGYCVRGEMENAIKEHQLDLFGERLSCHRFASNEVRLLLASFARLLLSNGWEDRSGGQHPRAGDRRYDPAAIAQARRASDGVGAPRGSIPDRRSKKSTSMPDKKDRRRLRLSLFQQ